MDDRARILRFRAAGHHLDERLPAADVVQAAAASGLRDVRGSALLALHARVEDVGPGLIEGLREDGALREVVSARGALTLVPAADATLFTLGTMPADEASLRTRLQPFLPVLDRSGHTAVEAVAHTRAVAREVLAAGPVDIGVLSGELTRALPELSPMCRGRCRVEHIEQGLFDLVGESGVWHVERDDAGERIFVPWPEPEPTDWEAARRAARVELVRRYLRAHGPSTARQFAEWCGIGDADARASLAEAGTVALDRQTFVGADDEVRLAEPPVAAGVRFLPAVDPYLLNRDRETTVPDKAVRQRLWRANPTDGLVLVDGEPVATWRPRTTARVLQVRVQPFTPLTRRARHDIEIEAATLAPLRDRAPGEVEWLPA
jgi:hypothetical protein